MVEAARYYESQQHDLGRRFLATIQDALNRIRVNPELYRTIEGDVRCCGMRPFPYGVLFLNRPTSIVVVAVIHLHRDPDYWKHRLQD